MLFSRLTLGTSDSEDGIVGFKGANDQNKTRLLEELRFPWVAESVLSSDDHLVNAYYDTEDRRVILVLPIFLMRPLVSDYVRTMSF